MSGTGLRGLMKIGNSRPSSVRTASRAASRAAETTVSGATGKSAVLPATSQSPARVTVRRGTLPSARRAAITGWLRRSAAFIESAAVAARGSIASRCSIGRRATS